MPEVVKYVRDDKEGFLGKPSTQTPTLMNASVPHMHKGILIIILTFDRSKRSLPVRRLAFGSSVFGFLAYLRIMFSVHLH